MLIFLAFTFSGPYALLNTFVLLQNSVLSIINKPVENVAVKDQAMQFSKVTDFPVIVCYVFENTAILYSIKYSIVLIEVGLAHGNF